MNNENKSDYEVILKPEDFMVKCLTCGCKTWKAVKIEVNYDTVAFICPDCISKMNKTINNKWPELER
jgi:Zn finger protein HypA/HybF involved in hydrogenase expression